MVDDNDDEHNDDFATMATTSIDDILISSASLHTKNYLENESIRITNNESMLSKSCCYNKLSSMDFMLKNMHKRWSIID